MGQDVMTFIAPHKALKIKEKGNFQIEAFSFQKGNTKRTVKETWDNS